MHIVKEWYIGTKREKIEHMENNQNSINVPHESYLRLFIRFLRFGLLAWGGPVPQIAMIRQELVDEEKWISNPRFNRVLAVYQALPGPEAHEMCVYFGMIARGRIGGFLAGLGFMLPGFLLMFALSWFYLSYGIKSPFIGAFFFGCQAAVGALILRAVHRIGGHALLDRSLSGIATVAGISALLGTHFLIILLLSGSSYILLKRSYYIPALALGIILIAGSAFYSMNALNLGMVSQSVSQAFASTEPPSILSLFYSGLRSGLLTFGGAYTVIPYLQHDAVEIGRWMTNKQFLDGLALSGILPAPLIIFSTFVGYIGGGTLGALSLTIGIFAPAFSFTLIGHKYLERIIENKALHVFNDGITAGVVGLIAATSVGLLKAGITNLYALGIFLLSMVLVYRLKSKYAVVGIVFSAGFIALLLKYIGLLK
jgi:chromate transporter